MIIIAVAHAVRERPDHSAFLIYAWALE